MKRLKSTFAALLLSVMLAACSHTKHEAIPAGATVLVLGDSVSHGTGAEKGEDYPTLLAGKTGWNVVNAGVPGDTTADGLARLPDLLEQHAPRLVLVELGGNDFLQQVPPAQIEANLRIILARIRAQGIPAIMIGAPRPNLLAAATGNLADDPVYGRIGDETETPVVSGAIADILEKNALKSDYIHPNAAGYRQLAESLYVELRDQGFLQ